MQARHALKTRATENVYTPRRLPELVPSHPWSCTSSPANSPPPTPRLRPVDIPFPEQSRDLVASDAGSSGGEYLYVALRCEVQRIHVRLIYRWLLGSCGTCQALRGTSKGSPVPFRRGKEAPAISVSLLRGAAHSLAALLQRLYGVTVTSPAGDSCLRYHGHGAATTPSPSVQSIPESACRVHVVCCGCWWA